MVVGQWGVGGVERGSVFKVSKPILGSFTLPSPPCPLVISSTVGILPFCSFINRLIDGK